MVHFGTRSQRANSSERNGFPASKIAPLPRISANLLKGAASEDWGCAYSTDSGPGGSGPFLPYIQMLRRQQPVWWIKAFAIGLVFVVAIFASAQAAHLHSSDTGTDAHCQLCLMAHHSIVPTIVIAPVQTPAVVSLVSLPRITVEHSRTVLTHSIRPPPISL